VETWWKRESCEYRCFARVSSLVATAAFAHHPSVPALSTGTVTFLFTDIRRLDAADRGARRGRRAARLPIETFQAVAQFVEHVRGYRVFATDDLLNGGEDWTERLRAAAG